VSTLSYKDPSGLAPEKEKDGRNQIQQTLTIILLQAAFEEGVEVCNQAKWSDYFDSMQRLNVFKNAAYLFFNNWIGNAWDPSGGGHGDGRGSGTGGDGSIGRLGNTGSENGVIGAWILSMKLEMPKKRDVESLNKAVEPANNFLDMLQEAVPDVEVGYLLRYNTKTNELWADFFIGEDKDTWLDLSKNPYGSALDKDEMIIGFTHTHLGEPDHFGPDDRKAIKELSLGRITWTNIPWYTQNNNPSFIDIMYFEVRFSGGTEILSWNNTTPTNLHNFYNDIIKSGNYTRPLNYYKASEFWRKIGW